MKKTLIISPKAFKASLLFGLICSIFLSQANFNVACDDLRQNVLRLHIIANSDLDYDQELKLKVRDAVLENSKDLFKDLNDITTAVTVTNQKKDEIKNIASNVIKENGYDYSVKVSVENSYFSTREYDTFTLPAGEYPSLKIIIGEGNGKNWWCVIFPEVCIPTAIKPSLSDSVKDGGCKIAENPEKYVVRFKIVEIYEKIKKLFR